jgi:hypothetical protein
LTFDQLRHLEMIIGGVLLRQREHLAIRILHQDQGKIVLTRRGELNHGFLKDNWLVVINRLLMVVKHTVNGG